MHTSGRQLQANTQRIEEIQVLDMVFLHTANKPTLAILYEDNHIIAVNKKPSEISQSDKTGDISLLDKNKK